MDSIYRLKLKVFFISLLLLWAFVSYLYPTEFFLFLNKNVPVFLQSFFLLLTSLADAFFAILILILYRRRRPGKLFPTLIALGVSALLVQLLKSYFHTPRPAAAIDEEFNILGMALYTRSFPSGHSATAMVLARFLADKQEGLTRFFYLAMGVLMAISRVVVGAHFPLDILVGGLIGYFIADFILSRSYRSPLFSVYHRGRIWDVLGLVWIYVYFRFYHEKTEELLWLLNPLAIGIACFLIMRIWYLSGRKTKVILAILLLSVALLFKWIVYVEHLAIHQAKVLLNLQKIENVKSISPQAKEKLIWIQKVKKFAISKYGLKESKSFRYFVKIPRKALGWNLTVAYPLKLEAKAFYFPFIGKFAYLGFFDKALLLKWKENYQQQYYDTCVSQIAAYSTLGFFPDPIFSTFLSYSKESLARLVLHELAHERIYFKNDTDFSEQVAVFFEDFLFREFYQQEGLPLPEKKGYYQQKILFAHILRNTTSKLTSLFQSGLSHKKKLLRKKAIYEELRSRIQNLTHIPEVRWLLSYPKINNAIFIQVMRYTPPDPNSSKGFASLERFCHENLSCMLTELDILKEKSIPNEKKKLFLQGKLTWAQLKHFSALK
ncbi:MAG: phosphatase PAP2 family protein [Candidatus Hydrogenedentota bacterium]|nr:MAG: phosphatase PAP2 family protein [Candidatus Hydrogenedentota bacterium]